MGIRLLSYEAGSQRPLGNAAGQFKMDQGCSSDRNSKKRAMRSDAMILVSTLHGRSLRMLHLMSETKDLLCRTQAWRHSVLLTPCRSLVARHKHPEDAPTLLLTYGEAAVANYSDSDK